MLSAFQIRHQLENENLIIKTEIEFETQPAQAGAIERLRRITRAMLAVWLRVANSRLLSYVVFAAIYLPPIIILARHKVLWEDEFFTLYLSSTHSWKELFAALSTGADQHPPSFYYLTHLIFGIFGTTNVTLRLTAITGYAVMCICLYEIGSRLLSRPWAFAAILLPLSCPAKYYAIEARGYGLELGFVTLALLMWMLATDGCRRSVTLPLLAIGVSGAVASHYYAVLILVPLGVAELFRTRSRHRLDLGIWAALGSMVIPLSAFMPSILKAQTYSSHFWAAPQWRNVTESYLILAGPLILLAIGVCAFTELVSGTRHAPYSGLDPRTRSWQLIGFVVLSSLPMWAMFIAKSLTHAYESRYVVAVFPGICVLLILGLARMSRYSKEAAALVWVLSVVGFYVAVVMSFQKQNVAYEEMNAAATALRKSEQMPVATPDPTIFHRLSFYAKADLAQRVVYISDPHSSLRYLKHDTVDRGLLALNPWFPLNVQWPHAWLSTHPSFLVYSSIGNWAWLPRGLSDSHDEIKVLGVSNEAFLLMSVQNIKVPNDDRVPGDPTGEPMLYSRIRRDGKSLCEIYMPTETCPNLNQKMETPAHQRGDAGVSLDP